VISQRPSKATTTRRVRLQNIKKQGGQVRTEFFAKIKGANSFDNQEINNYSYQITEKEVE